MPRIRINLRRVLTIAGIIILILMIVDFNRRIEVMNSLSRQADIRRAQATQAVQTQMSLQTQVAFAASTEAVNDWARTEGHYVQDGDQPVVPVGQPGSDLGSESPRVTATNPTPRSVGLPFIVA